MLSDDPLGLWPEWLLASVRPAPVPSTAPIASLPECSETYVEAVLRSAIEQVSRAREGIRNATLNAEAYSLARFVAAGQLDGQHVADALAAAAVAAGLAPREIIPTLRSAFRARGVA